MKRSLKNFGAFLFLLLIIAVISAIVFAIASSRAKQERETTYISPYSGFVGTYGWRFKLDFPQEINPKELYDEFNQTYQTAEWGETAKFTGYILLGGYMERDENHEYFSRTKLQMTDGDGHVTHEVFFGDIFYNSKDMDDYVGRYFNPEIPSICIVTIEGILTKEGQPHYQGAGDRNLYIKNPTITVVQEVRIKTWL